MTIRKELLDELLEGCDPSRVLSRHGLLGGTQARPAEPCLAAAFDHHLPQEQAAGLGKNHRNGSSRKRVLTDAGHVDLNLPRDREARFDPVLVGKHQRRLPGFPSAPLGDRFRTPWSFPAGACSPA